MRTRGMCGLLAVAAFAAMAGLLPPESWCQESSELAESATPSVFFGSMDISGSLHSTYQFRTSDGEDDHDIYEYLSLRFKDIVKDRVDGAFSMFWHEDLNGDTSLRPRDDYDMFLDLDQASDNRFKFYTGYVDIKQLLFEDSNLVLGRQYIEEIDYAHFDGGTYRFSPLEPLEITLFGGRPITYYSSTSGDAFYGGGVKYQFTPRTKGALRYYRYDANQFTDDLGTAEVWHMFAPWLQTHLEFSLLDGDPYMLQGDVFGRVDAIDLDANVQVIRLFETIGDHTINFNPYFPLLNGYEPFTYGSIFLTKGLGRYVSLIGGFDIREAESIADPVTAHTNRDYLRFTAGAEFYPTEQLTLSVNGEFWDADPDDEFTGVTGEIEYRPAKPWTLAAGVDYGEYIQEYRDEFLFNFGQQDLFRITPDVLTYYGRVRWKPTDSIYSSARFEVEDSDFDDDNWYSLRLELGVYF